MRQSDQLLFLVEFMDMIPHVYKMLFQSVETSEVSSLPATQLRALFIVIKNGKQSMSSLAELLSIPRQQLTKVVHALVEKQLVRRKINAANRRMILIEATEKGEALMQSILEHNLTQCSSYFSALTPEDQQILLKAMEIVKRVLIPSFSEQNPT